MRAKRPQYGPFALWSLATGKYRRRERLVGWDGRVRTSEWRNQNPLPYHLATSQRSVSTPLKLGLVAGFDRAFKPIDGVESVTKTGGGKTRIRWLDRLLMARKRVLECKSTGCGPCRLAALYTHEKRRMKLRSIQSFQNQTQRPSTDHAPQAAIA